MEVQGEKRKLCMWILLGKESKVDAAIFSSVGLPSNVVILHLPCNRLNSIKVHHFCKA